MADGTVAPPLRSRYLDAQGRYDRQTEACDTTLVRVSMNFSSRWLMPILVASGLLLNGARGWGVQETAQNKEHQAQSAVHVETTSQQQPQVPLAIFESNQTALLEALRAIEAQARSQWKQLGLLVVGIFYTIFAALQWKAIRRQAESAERALHVDRPILVPDNFAFSDQMLVRTFHVLRSSEPLHDEARLIHPFPVSVTFTLSNYGKRPAEIKQIAGRVAAITKIDDIPIGNFSQCSNWPTPRNVLNNGEPITISSPYTAFLREDVLTPDDQRAIIDAQKILVVYGQISYSDVGSELILLSDFFWIYSAFLLTHLGKGGVLRGPDDRNQRHQ
jgi:hypothetical protein